MTEVQLRILKVAEELAETFTDDYLKQAYLLGVETGLHLMKIKDIEAFSNHFSEGKVKHDPCKKF